MTGVVAPELFDAGPGEPYSVARFLSIVRRRFLVVLVVLALALAAAALQTKRQHPSYAAQSKIVVGQGNMLFQAPNGTSIQPFTATMSDLLTSNVVAERVRASLGLQESTTALLKQVSVSINPQTAVMTMTVTDSSSRRAVATAVAFGDAFTSIVSQRFGHLSASAATATPPVTATVFDPAHALPGRVSPHLLRNLVLAGGLGLVLGIAAAFLRDRLARRLHPDEIAAAFGLPSLGEIPYHRGLLHRRAGKAPIWATETPELHAYRTLRTALSSRRGRRPRTIVVTAGSAAPDKESVAANLAAAFAATGARALLVEADLGHARLDKLAGEEAGIAAVLSKRVPLQAAAAAALLPGGLARRLEQGQLDVLGAGSEDGLEPDDLLVDSRLRELLSEAARRYDYLVCDGAPLLESAAGIELARLADAVVLVAGRRTDRDEARAVRALQERFELPLTGIVLADGADTGPAGHIRRLLAVPLRPHPGDDDTQPAVDVVSLRDS